MFDFRRVTVFCLGCRLSKHKLTMYVTNLGGMAPCASLTTPISEIADNIYTYSLDRSYGYS